MKGGIRKRRWIHRALVRTLTCLVLAALATMVYLHVHGFPPWVVDRFMARLSQGRFSLETDAVRVDVLHGLELVSLKAYCKQVIGPPALTAENVSVTIDPLALLARRPCVQALRISKGVIRPGMTRGPRPAP